MKVGRLFAFILVIALLSLFAIYYPKFTGEAVINSDNYQRESVYVERVIDGDTLVYKIGNISQTARLLGINNKSV